MDIIQEKELISRLILAVTRVLDAPSLFMGAFFSKAEILEAEETNFLEERAARHARENGYVVLGDDHPAYSIVHGMAAKAGLNPKHVYMNPTYEFCNAAVGTLSGKDIEVFITGDPTKIPDHGTAFLKDVAGHELTHAARQVNRHLSRVDMTQAASFLSTIIYGVAAAVTSFTVLEMVAGISAFSAAVGIPMLRKMFIRNEEYLADIGGAVMTGDPRATISCSGYLRGVAMDDSIPKPVGEFGGSFADRLSDIFFGREHPSDEDRADVICQAFNISAEECVRVHHTSGLASQRPALQ